MLGGDAVESDLNCLPRSGPRQHTSGDTVSAGEGAGDGGGGHGGGGMHRAIWTGMSRAVA